MKVHVLGQWGTYPAPGEATTGFFVETNRAKILLDCGSGVLAQLFHVCSIQELNGVVITHHHYDHVADLGVLSYTALIARLRLNRTQQIPLFMPKGSPDLTNDLKKEPLLKIQHIDAASRIEIEDVHISFIRTKHTPYCVAVRMEHEGRIFVFSADSSECGELRQIAAGADLFICEASMFDGQEDLAKQTGHLTAPQAGRIAKDAAAKRLAITHYPHNSDLELLRQQAQEAFGGAVELLSTRQVLNV